MLRQGRKVNQSQSQQHADSHTPSQSQVQVSSADPNALMSEANRLIIQNAIKASQNFEQHNRIQDQKEKAEREANLEREREEAEPQRKANEENERRQGEKNQ